MGKSGAHVKCYGAPYGMNEITPHISRNCWDPETVESG
jgi:hypothetical protein